MSNISEQKKLSTLTKIEKAISEAPEGCCGSPDVVLGVHIMQEIYKDLIVDLMNSF